MTLKVPTFLDAEISPVDLLIFMIENVGDINWQGLSEFYEEDQAKMIQSLHESILHAIEKLKRVKKKKEDAHLALSLLVKDRIDKHKLFIPSGI